jgi:glutathione S-transferase
MLTDRPFLAGNALTLADIPAGTGLYRYFELDIERPSVPNVEAWYRRLQDRPAYRAHVMVPFGELAGRLDP